MLDTSVSMLIMSYSSCSLLYPLLKMTGLFVSITFRQEDQKNRSTRSPSQHNLLKLRNQRRSQSQTFALISPMSSQKRPITFSPLIDPSITPSNSRIPFVTVEDPPILFSPFSLADCTMLDHFSFNDFIAVAFPDLAGDLDIQI